MVHPLPPNLQCVRCVWVYEGKPDGPWQSEQIQWGLTVAPYVREQVPVTTAGTVILDRHWIRESSLRQDTPAYRILFGWERHDTDDNGPAGLASQVQLLQAALALAVGLRNRLGNLYRLARIELRPQNDRLTTDTPATVLTPINTDADPIATGVQPPQLGALVRARTLRRGSHGRGLTYMGPLPSSMPDSNGLLSTTYRNAVLALFTVFARDIRTPPNPLQVSAWAPVVWQKSSPLAAVIRSFALPDEVGIQRSRARQRTPQVTELVL